MDDADFANRLLYERRKLTVNKTPAGRYTDAGLRERMESLRLDKVRLETALNNKPSKRYQQVVIAGLKFIEIELAKLKNNGANFND